MAIQVKHSKVSTIPDTDDTSLVRPSDWNADHVLTGTIPVANGGTGADNPTDARTNLSAAKSGANSDITSMTGVTGGISSPDYIQFDTTYATTLTTGQLGWDGNDTLGLGMSGGNVVQEIGLQTFIYGKASSAITKGQLIKKTGANGSSGVITFAPTTANMTNSTDIIGIAAEDIALNGFGYIMSTGNLRGFNTTGASSGETWADGDTLYYNPAGNGLMTKTKPSAPNSKTEVAVVTNAGSGGSGSVVVEIIHGTQLGGTDSNVQLTSVNNGNILSYDGGNGYWKNTDLTAGTGISISKSANGVLTVTNSSPNTYDPSNVAITGGTINGTSIGATTPSTGKFTTLEATGTSTLGTASNQYLQAAGGSTEAQLSAQGAGTNIPLVLQPKGTGAIQAQATTSTATGGNARGANAVDWQTARSTAAQVASASFGVISGGTTNTVNGFGSVIGGGFNNTNSATSYGFIGSGTANTVSGNRAVVVGGDTNSALGVYNFIGGGQLNSGTANAAVTTQSATMNGTTAVTLSGSNASIRVGQLITGTSIASNTYVAAISGTSLTLSQAASGSSTSTLSFFTPHGVVVGGGNNQATGAYSFIGGGGDAGTAANRNVASGDWSFVGGGVKNTASGTGSVVCGGGHSAAAGSGINGNTASSTSSFVGGGYSNTATANSSAVLGGNFNAASGNNSAVIAGSRGTTRGLLSYTVFAASSPLGTTVGASQTAVSVLGTITTDATPTVLCSDANAASTTNQVILPNNSAYYFTGEIVSGVTGGGNSKGWEISGLIKRGANAAATTLVGSTVTSLYADAGAATWTIALAADTTNGGLRVTFTGQAGTTIRTVCQIRTTEMTY